MWLENMETAKKARVRDANSKEAENYFPLWT